MPHRLALNKHAEVGMIQVLMQEPTWKLVTPQGSMKCLKLTDVPLCSFERVPKAHQATNHSWIPACNVMY